MYYISQLLNKHIYLYECVLNVTDFSAEKNEEIFLNKYKLETITEIFAIGVF